MENNDIIKERLQLMVFDKMSNIVNLDNESILKDFYGNQLKNKIQNEEKYFCFHLILSSKDGETYDDGIQLIPIGITKKGFVMYNKLKNKFNEI